MDRNRNVDARNRPPFARPAPMDLTQSDSDEDAGWANGSQRQPDAKEPASDAKAERKAKAPAGNKGKRAKGRRPRGEGRSRMSRFWCLTVFPTTEDEANDLALEAANYEFNDGGGPAGGDAPNGPYGDPLEYWLAKRGGVLGDPEFVR